MSGARLAAQIRAGTRRAADVVEERLADIAARNADFNAFTEVTAARARAEAAAVDAKVAAGQDPGGEEGADRGTPPIPDIRHDPLVSLSVVEWFVVTASQAGCCGGPSPAWRRARG